MCVLKLQARHFDTALMAIGLLTNCLEVLPVAAAQIGATVPGVAASHANADTCGRKRSSKLKHSPDDYEAVPLITLLSRTLGMLMKPIGEVTELSSDASLPSSSSVKPPVNTAEVDEKMKMEREVMAAYLSVLVGFLCREHTPFASIALDALGEDNFARVSALLQSFLELQAEVSIRSPATSRICFLLLHIRPY